MNDWTFCKCGAIADDICLICGYSKSQEEALDFAEAVAKIGAEVHNEMWLTMPARVDHVAAACLKGAQSGFNGPFGTYRDGLD